MLSTGVIDPNMLSGTGSLGGAAESQSHNSSMAGGGGMHGSGGRGSPGRTQSGDRPRSFVRDGTSDPGHRSNAPAGDTESLGMPMNKPPSISSPGGMPYGMPSPGHVMGYGPGTGAMHTMGVMGAMPGAYATMAPYGVWYPPSPHGAMAYGWTGGQPGAYGSSYGECETSACM